MTRRVGRPQKKLTPAKDIVTRRIRALVHLAHEGNLNEASKATGIPYPTVRDLYTGRTANPGVKTLEALGQPYGLDVGWFTDPKRRETGMLAGVIGRLPPHPKEPKDRLREVLIPFNAWPMYEVYTVLWDWLDLLESRPQRPIVGDAKATRYFSAKDVFNLRLTSFLLRPLLDAEEKLEDAAPVLKRFPMGGDKFQTDEEREAWVETLRALGRTWQRAIPDILAKARTEVANARRASTPLL